MDDLYNYDYGHEYNTDKIPGPFPDKETSDMNDDALEALRKKLVGDDKVDHPSYYTQYQATSEGNGKVDHPSYYTRYKGLEVIDLTEQMNFNRGNAVKYIARAGFKDPTTTVEDLQKAKWYIEREIQRITRN